MVYFHLVQLQSLVALWLCQICLCLTCKILNEQLLDVDLLQWLYLLKGQCSLFHLQILHCLSVLVCFRPSSSAAAFPAVPLRWEPMYLSEWKLYWKPSCRWWGSVWCFLMHSIPYVRIDTWEKNDQSCQTQKQKELTSTIRRSNPHASAATEQQIQVHIINGVTSFLPWLNTQQSWTSDLWLLAISSGPSTKRLLLSIHWHRSAKRYGTITKILPFGMPRHVKSFKLIVPIVYCYDFQRLQNGRRPRTNIIQYLSCRIFHNTNADIGMIWFGCSRSFAE